MVKITPVFLAFLLLACPPAKALETAWSDGDYIQARLLGGGAADGPNAALELRLDEGWHAFWRMPGDGGLPPAFDWNGSGNLEKVEVFWPLPERFDTAGLYSFGYHGAVILPLAADALQPDEPVVLDLKADLMVCKDICVPQKVALQMTLPPGGAKDSPHSDRIAAAMAKVPGESAPNRLVLENVVLGPEAIVVTAYSSSGFEHADLFIESGDIYVTALPEITPDKGDPRKAMIRVAGPEHVANLANELSARDIRLTLTNGSEAVEKTIAFGNQ